MALAWDLAAVLWNDGPLQLSERTIRRVRSLEGYFHRVSLETKAHPRGPIPVPLLQAMAWTESAFRPGVDGPELGGGDRAEGLMQIHSGHYGRVFYTNPPFDWPSQELPNLAFTWREELAHDPLPNLRAAAHILLVDAGFGATGPWGWLGKYGGWVTKSPREYVRKVATRYFYLTGRDWIGGGL